MEHRLFGNTGLVASRIVHGTSSLGNLFVALPDATKLAISREWFANQSPPVLIDSAGKYGAGLSLEMIGRNLHELQIPPEQVVISNKLGWKRVPRKGPEPTFEPGAWIDLEYDAEQCISYDGILECWEQGCELLGQEYPAQLLSVHDPDEYLAAAASSDERAQRLEDIVDAYRALSELKGQGRAQGIGVGSKDWRIIQELDGLVDLDWVMLANSLTLYRHPQELLEFVSDLQSKGVAVINSAVFQAGFLVGGEFFDYRRLDPQAAANRPLFAWREKFLALCQAHHVKPAVACIQFALSPPGVDAIALSTSSPERVAKNIAAVEHEIAPEFWTDAKQVGLLEADYPYLG